MLWALTDEHLHIFATKFSYLRRRPHSLRRLHILDRKCVAARQTKELDYLPGAPDYAVIIQGHDVPQIEAQAVTHSPEAKAIIEALIGKPISRLPR
jgi:hypothetical protein